MWLVHIRAFPFRSGFSRRHDPLVGDLHRLNLSGLHLFEQFAVSYGLYLLPEEQGT